MTPGLDQIYFTHNRTIYKTKYYYNVHISKMNVLSELLNIHNLTTKINSMRIMIYRNKLKNVKHISTNDII